MFSTKCSHRQFEYNIRIVSGCAAREATGRLLIFWRSLLHALADRREISNKMPLLRFDE